ncbi:hypothetical protein BD324DRAFT_618837 [Kockovaella imperatae]|uniref:Uncharacterized protein n=1 Tax=Kockovaella imperatae TaxID=4999 RepID=A0A1Y1UNW8_9TREE|nr:hypothetical protein BD324DRAFT_618837 [Kockovaella imperatae]ORX39204.1 hypothetical protein BD324DRAFT_618837 [Kockovaella imperatae]
MQQGLSVLPDMKAPKSPRRLFASFTPTKLFHHFDTAPPVPCLPVTIPSSDTFDPTSPPLSHYRKGHTPTLSQSSSTSSLGNGAQIVKTPLDAMRDLRPPLRNKTSSKSLAQISHSQSRWSQSSSEDPSPSDRRQTLKAKLSLHSMSTKASTPKLPELKHLRSQPSLGGWYPQGMEPFDSPDRRSDAVGPATGFENRRQSQCFSEKQMRDARRSTVKPPRRSPSTPFKASLISKFVRPAPTAKSEILITLQFGFSSMPPRNTHVTLPWHILREAGGQLAEFVSDYVDTRRESGMSDKPSMTDGSSASESDLESEFDLDTLLRDEYMKSIYMSPSQAHFMDLPLPLSVNRQMSEYEFPPLPPLPNLPPDLAKKLSQSRPTPKIVTLPGEKKRAVKNQYTQLDPYPSPSSALLSPQTSLGARRKGQNLKIEAKLLDGGGTITQLTVLLMRDANVYHLLVARLVGGTFEASDEQREALEVECRWLGMIGLADEIGWRRERSMVRRGGEGYI